MLCCLEFVVSVGQMSGVPSSWTFSIPALQNTKNSSYIFCVEQSNLIHVFKIKPQC